MAYNYETGQDRTMGTSEMRPHEFPSRSGGSAGTVIGLGVVILIIGIVIVASTFSGGGDAVAPAADGAGDTAVITPPADGTAPAAQ